MVSIILKILDVLFVIIITNYSLVIINPRREWALVTLAKLLDSLGMATQTEITPTGFLARGVMRLTPIK